MASPSKTSKKQMEQFNMRLESAVLAQLDHMAAERSTTRTDVFRTLLAAWMRDPSSVVVGFPLTVNGGAQ